MKTETKSISQEAIKRALKDDDLRSILSDTSKIGMTYSDRKGYHASTSYQGHPTSSVAALENVGDFEFSLAIHKTRRNHEPFIYCNLVAHSIVDLQNATDGEYTVETYMWSLTEAEAATLGFLESSLNDFQKSSKEDLLNASKEDLIEYTAQLESAISEIAGYVKSANKISRSDLIEMLNSLS